jgi:hypothetical protein
MLENEVINIENKNPNSEIESLDDLKQNLIKDITEEKDFKKDNKENESTDQEEKEEVSSNDLLNINDIINNANKENKVKEEKDLNVSSFYSNKSEKNEEIFNSSKFDRESLYNAIKENNSKIDKKKREFNINKKLLRRIMIIIEILFGSLLGSSCILLLIMLIEEKVTHQKIIGAIIEPLILIISFVGMLPISNITYKKIKFALYIWECILLIPLSFYVKSSIDGKYFLFDLIIKIRIGLLAFQIINFVISLIFKIDI